MEDGELKSKTFVIKNRLGLHARPAGLMAQIANKYEAEIKIEKDSLEVDGKSIMGIMMLAATVGSAITIKVKGKDATFALEKLGKLIENKFGEE